MKGNIRVVTAFVLTLIMSVNVVFAASFSDIGEHWAKDSILNWVEKGLISGYSDGTFRPDRAITRAEFIYIINRAYGFNDTVSPAEITYSDVPADEWFYSSIRVAKAVGYITGYDNGTMRPNNSITREEAAVVITKLNNLTPDASKAVGFKDSSSFESWSKPYIGAVAEATYMKGDTEGNFNPTQNLTRAEAVVLLINSSKDYDGQPVTGTAIKIDLPVTTDVAIKSTNYIIRYSTTPKDVTIKATTNNELLTVDAFSDKMTLNTGSKAGITRITLTMSKENYETTEFIIDINVTDEAAKKALATDVSKLTEDSITFLSPDTGFSSVTRNMNIPTQGEKGSIITWESSNTDIIKIQDGRATVTQPYYTNGKDTVVTLTAAFENNGYEEKKTFNVTVLRADPSDNVDLKSEGYSIAASGNNTVISSARKSVTESLTVKEFLENLDYHPYATVKVVSADVGKTITSLAKFDSAESRATSKTLTDGDYLAIKSESGERYRVYAIKTMAQVNAVTDFKWNGSGSLSWTKPSTTYGYYIEIYKNGTLLDEEETRATNTTINVLDIMKKGGVGSYTAVIYNKGDLTRYAHSASVETSTEQRVTQLSEPSNLRWSGSSAIWSGDNNADEYKVTLYRDGVQYKVLTTSATMLDLSEHLKIGGDFKFRVTSIAESGSLGIDSDISDSSSVISR